MNEQNNPNPSSENNTLKQEFDLLQTYLRSEREKKDTSGHFFCGAFYILRLYLAGELNENLAVNLSTEVIEELKNGGIRENDDNKFTDKEVN